MLKFIWILMVFASFQSIAESCYIQDEDQFALGEKHRKSFKFSFWETPEAGTVFQIEVPKTLNDKKFEGMLLVKGLREKVADGYAIPIAFMSHDSQKGMLMSTISMDKYMFEGALISITYGTEGCTPDPIYKVSELLKDKNNWPYR